MRKRLGVFLVIVSFLAGCSKETDCYTVVVSLDAFRWDYPDVVETPGLNEIASDGVRCVMEPSYPASTFPNHYAIATGLVAWSRTITELSTARSGILIRRSYTRWETVQPGIILSTILANRFG